MVAPAASLPHAGERSVFNLYAPEGRGDRKLHGDKRGGPTGKDAVLRWCALPFQILGTSNKVALSGSIWHAAGAVGWRFDCGQRVH